MTRVASRESARGLVVGRGRRGVQKIGPPQVPTAEGFALLEVLLAVVLLMGVMVATTSLVVTAVQVGASSRMRVLATDIASGQLDCAVASLNVTTFPTPAPCNEPAALINEMGLSGSGSIPAITAVSEAGFTFTIEQQVNPGNSACAVPSGLAPPELQVTDWVTWAPGVSYASTWWEQGTAMNNKLAGRFVQESTLVAVPASALNQNDGSLLVNVTDNASVGQEGVTVTAVGPSPATTSSSVLTTSPGCALFVNLSPGNYSVTASLSGWIDSNDDLTGGSPAPATWTTSVSADTTTKLTGPPYYAQEATIASANYSVAPIDGVIPTTPSGTSSLPLSLYNTNMGTSVQPYVVSPPADAYAWSSYQAVAGACGSNSIPDGTWSTRTPSVDGSALPSSGSMTQGSSNNTANITLSPIVVEVTYSGTQEPGATVTAVEKTTAAATDGNCTTAMQSASLGLGTTAAVPVGGATTTTVSSSANPSVSGQAVTFAAVVAPQGIATATPTGTVTFYSGAPPSSGDTVICAGATLSAAGVATCSPSPNLVTGTYSIWASYSGDTNFTSSNSSLSIVSQGVVVSPLQSTTTGLFSSANPGKSGNALTFSAQVLPSTGAGTPSGTVTLQEETSPSPVTWTTEATGSLNSSGFVTFSPPITLTNGTTTTYSFKAIYAGDGANFSGSTSSTFAEVVDKTTSFPGPYATTTAVTSSVSPSGSGEGVTFTATVSPPSTNTGYPAGTVTFKDAGTAITGCSAVPLSVWAATQASLAAATATCAALGSSLTTGTNSITAVYANADGNFSASTSAAFAQQVVADDLISGLPYIGSETGLSVAGSSGFLLSSTYAGHSSSTSGTSVVVQVYAPGGTACPSGCINVWDNGTEVATGAPLTYPVQVPA